MSGCHKIADKAEFDKQLSSGKLPHSNRVGDQSDNNNLNAKLKRSNNKYKRKLQ